MIGECDYNVHEFLRKSVGSIKPKEKSGPTAKSKSIIEQQLAEAPQTTILVARVPTGVMRSPTSISKLSALAL